jgi:hypothetical protein
VRDGHAAIGAGDDLMHVNLAISVTAIKYSRLARKFDPMSELALHDSADNRQSCLTLGMMFACISLIVTIAAMLTTIALI